MRRPTIPALAAALLAACAMAGGDDVPSGDGGTGGPDGAPPADVDPLAPDGAGGPADAAGPADGALPPSEVVSLGPAMLVLTRGATGSLTVTLDRPALAGGALVTLSSDDPGGATITVPASVTVPAGQATATFDVTGVAVGGPLDVRATFEASVAAASVRVAPALTGLTPADADVTVGTTVTFTVLLEATTAGPVDVVLASAAPAILQVPPAVTIAAGSSSATFGGTGLALGGPVDVTAAIGSASSAATARVVGLYFSEILYDVSGTDSDKEWIELYNAAPVAIDVTGMKVQVANTSGPYLDALTLGGALASGQCVVIGGPLAGAVASNFTPEGFVYFVAGDFVPDLGNAGSASVDPGDGLQLATAAGDVVDNVLYGRNNNDGITDEDGLAPAVTDVGDAATSQTLERSAPGLAGPWAIQASPNPGDCAAIAP